MGYETKLYFVEKSAHPLNIDDGVAYCNVIATIDLSKAGEGALARLVRNSRPKEPAVYVFADDGNTHITRDRYDECLSVMDPADVLAAIKKDNAHEPYRRFAAAIALLEALIPAFEDLKVLGYGH
jgi:hypothetical protein